MKINPTRLLKKGDTLEPKLTSSEINTERIMIPADL